MPIMRPPELTALKITWPSAPTTSLASGEAYCSHRSVMSASRSASASCWKSTRRWPPSRVITSGKSPEAMASFSFSCACEPSATHL